MNIKEAAKAVKLGEKTFRRLRWVKLLNPERFEELKKTRKGLREAYQESTGRLIRTPKTTNLRVEANERLKLMARELEVSQSRVIEEAIHEYFWVSARIGYQIPKRNKMGTSLEDEYIGKRISNE